MFKPPVYLLYPLWSTHWSPLWSTHWSTHWPALPSLGVIFDVGVEIPECVLRITLCKNGSALIHVPRRASRSSHRLFISSCLNAHTMSSGQKGIASNFVCCTDYGSFIWILFVVLTMEHLFEFCLWYLWYLIWNIYIDIIFMIIIMIYLIFDYVKSMSIYDTCVRKESTYPFPIFSLFMNALLCIPFCFSFNRKIACVLFSFYLLSTLSLVRIYTR